MVFAKTLQYSYLFGLLPTLMMAAVDDILFHVKRISPVLRMLIVGVLVVLRRGVALRFARDRTAASLQFLLYGLVGFIPGVISSWLAHEAIDEPATVVARAARRGKQVGAAIPTSSPGRRGAAAA